MKIEITPYDIKHAEWMRFLGSGMADAANISPIAVALRRMGHEKTKVMECAYTFRSWKDIRPFSKEAKKHIRRFAKYKKVKPCEIELDECPDDIIQPT